FYAGAMGESDQIEIKPIADRLGGLDLVLIGPSDPAAMLQYTDECRDRGYPFAADISQQLAIMEARTSRSWSRVRPTCSPSSTRCHCYGSTPMGPRTRAATGSAAG